MLFQGILAFNNIWEDNVVQFLLLYFTWSTFECDL